MRAGEEDWPTFSCDAKDAGQRGYCATNALDLAVANALVLAPRTAGYSSHVFTFVACPALVFRNLAETKVDGAIWAGTNLISAGLNT